jgi:putative ABC transport system permease protein
MRPEHWVYTIPLRLRSLFRRTQADQELDDEMSDHVELRTEEYVSKGLAPEEARRQALLEIGGVEKRKEECRETRHVTWIQDLAQNLRYGVRMLRKSPGFTTVAVLTLALGIGANTAIFSVVNSVLLQSLPFSRPSELLDISARSTNFDFTNLGLSLPDIADLQNSSKSLAALAVYQDSPNELAADKPQRLEATAVSKDFFIVLGLGPILGRTFTSEDMQPGGRSVILSYPLWRDAFAADAAVLGRTITLDAQPHTIIGVMAAEPALGFATDSKLFTPFIPTEEQLADRGNHAYSVIARLRPRTTVARVQSELDTMSARLASAYPDVDQGWSIHATPLKQYLLGDARTPLAILLWAVGFVLMIACANVSNLFLARGWARRREFAIRSAMGASRSVLIRQVAVESLVVAVAGGAFAFAFAMWTVQALCSTLPREIPRLQEIRIDSYVAWFTVGTSLLAALLSGLAPALLSTGGDLSVAVRETSTSTPGRGSGHNFLRQLLVVGEVALACTLLVGATLALRSFGQLLRLDLGFQPEHLLTLRLDFPKFRFASTEPAIVFVKQVLESTRSTPGVTAASAGLVFPMSDEFAETTFETEAIAADPKHAQQSALANRVAPDFFRTLGIPLLAGRDFTDADIKGNSPVFVVNATLAKKYFGSTDAVGKRFSSDFSSGHPVWGQIVGVAGNVRGANHFDPQDDFKPQIYAPFYQTPRIFGVYLVVRSAADPSALAPALQERIWSIDKNQPVTAVATLDQRIAEVNASPRSQTLLLGIFAALGLLLALIGVYGVMSYLVGMQTREIGIRVALGADRGRILHLVIVQGLKLTLSGIFIGIVIGLALTRFMGSLLFGVSAADPLTYVTVTLLLLVVATAACSIPARRAARVDPMVALRCE